MKHHYLYTVSYEFKDPLSDYDTWCHGEKNIVANGSARGALRKAEAELKKLEPDAKSVTITSIERVCEVHAL